MLQTEKHFNYLILFLHSFGWFYNIKIGFVGLQVMWITFCLNNWQKSREKQNKLSFASKKTRRCLSCKFKFLPNNCQNSPNKVLYISRLTKYIFRTTLNVQWMFWSFSNCQILESNLGTFRKTFGSDSRVSRCSNKHPRKIYCNLPFARSIFGLRLRSSCNLYIFFTFLLKK